MKNSMIIIFLFLFFFFSPAASGQDTLNEDSLTSVKGRTSFLLNVYGGPEVIGIGFNTYISNHVSLSFGIGIILDLRLGVNYYIFDRSRSPHSMYVGGHPYMIKRISIFGDGIFDDAEFQAGIYFPVGYELLTPKGFTMQIEFGPNLLKENWSQVNTGLFLGSLRIGYTKKKK